MSHLIHIRTGVAQSGGGEHDNLRADSAQLLIPQAHALDDSGSEVFDYHVAQADDLLGQLDSPGVGQV